MKWFRKALILSHRYLGIVLSLMFVMWFVTGIGMIYSRGMPRLTPQTRLARLSAIDLASVKLSPADAARKAGLVAAPDGRVTLQSVMDRPAYRLGQAGTLFADTGEWMTPLDPAAARKVAARFMNVSEEKVGAPVEVNEPDQWTLTLGGEMPLYKMSVDDATHTELYVSPEKAEVVQVTTRGSRVLSWVSTIPHFLYFAPLRMARNGVWLTTMTWVPAAACVLAALGIVLGIVQLRRSKPHIRYSGWMRWHHITGLVFGVITFTFAFSGLLSMEPWAWTERDEVEKGIQHAFNSRDLDLDEFKRSDLPALNNALNGRALKEIEFANVLDRPHYIARTSPDEAPIVGWPDGGHQPYFISRDPDASRVVIDADSMRIVNNPLPTESLVERVRQANPTVPVIESAFLNEYDSYYYSRDGQAPLPVVRVQLDDSEKTWVYVDPEVAQVVGQANRYNRIERWLYNALHTLDFSFLYYNRPLWDAVVIVVSLGGTAVSGIGLYLALKRVRRGLSWQGR